MNAWASIVEDAPKAKSYKSQRGLGGFVRSSWDEVTEIIAAANVYTAKTYGPDRVIGFSPIPAMSMVSHAAGARYLSLIGGVCLSFYDWYCDLPPASPQIWGEQTDVPESADWYNSSYIIAWGSNAADADPGRALLHRGAPRAPRPSPSPRTIPRWPSSPTSGSTPSRAPTPRWAWPSVT
ncbi:molybdopterin-dependent oxidoreductase [Pseudomonas aeruginosa]|nr:molybdopterin-dependent oxidoreductase [Pseudomonas aeruginosa]